MQTSRRPDPTATTAIGIRNAGWCRPPKTPLRIRERISGTLAAEGRDGTLGSRGALPETRVAQGGARTR